MSKFSTNSTRHSHIRDGWSQQEEASAHIPGDPGGAVRQSSFPANAAANSDLLIGTDITVDGPFDSVGNALDLTLVGDQVTTSTYDVDSKFLPVKNFPPVASGFEEAALDSLQRVYGSGGVTLPWVGRGIGSAYYPLRGHNQGFTVDGRNQRYAQGDWAGTVNTSGTATAYYSGTQAVAGSLWVRLPQGVYCRTARPLINPQVVGTNVNYMAFRVRLSTANTISAKLNWQWGGSAPSPDLFMRIARTTGTAGTISIDGSYRQYNDAVTTAVTTTSVPTTGLDMSKEIGFVMQWGYLTTAENATLRVKIYAFDPDFPPGGAPTVVIQMDLTNAMRTRFVGNNAFIFRSAGSGSDYYGFRDVVVSQTDDTWPVHYPVVVEPSLIGWDFTKNNLGVVPAAPAMSARPPIPAWSGSGWDYLNMICSARNLQMRVEGGVLMFHDMNAVAPEPVSNTMAPPTLRINASGRARTVDVIAHSSLTETAQLATTPTYRILSTSWQVGINEQFQFRVDLPPGEYLYGKIGMTIMDKDGTLRTQSDLWFRGARFDTYVDPDGQLWMTVRGPTDELNIGAGPWTIVGLDIVNVGFLEAPETVTMYTGAAETMITREQGGTVDNVLLGSQGDALDRGAWAAAEYGEPEMLLSFSVNDAYTSRFYPGRIVSYGYTYYRVMSAEHTKGGTTVTAVRYTTVANHDAMWPTTTVSVFDTYWAGNNCLASSVRPLQSSLAVGAADPKPFVRVYPSESKWRK